MNMLRALLLLTLFIQNGHAQSLPPGMTMHRIQAGTLDESGWTNADSTQGAFTATLPCLFNDFTVEDTSAKSPTTKVFTLGCLRNDQRKFSVSRVQYRNGNADAQTFFERNAIGAKWPQATVVRSTFQGFATIDFELDDGTNCGFMRFLHAPPDNLLMVVEAPAAACRGLDKMVKRFFGSLAVRPR